MNYEFFHPAPKNWQWHRLSCFQMILSWASCSFLIGICWSGFCRIFDKGPSADCQCSPGSSVLFVTHLNSVLISLDSNLHLFTGQLPESWKGRAGRSLLTCPQWDPVIGLQVYLPRRTAQEVKLHPVFKNTGFVWLHILHCRQLISSLGSLGLVSRTMGSCAKLYYSQFLAPWGVAIETIPQTP